MRIGNFTDDSHLHRDFPATYLFVALADERSVTCRICGTGLALPTLRLDLRQAASGRSSRPNRVANVSEVLCTS